MRTFLLLLASTTLAACGGAGVQTAGSAAPQTGSGSGGTGGGSSGGGTTPPSGHTFVNPTEEKTYSGIGGAHSYKYSTNGRGDDPSTRAIEGISGQDGQLYAGDASTARDSGITISYNPRDAIFNLKITRPLGNVDQTVRFQDPAHRTDFGGANEPQGGVPDITSKGVRYLEVDSGSSGVLVFDTSISDAFPIREKASKSDVSTFFYQKPGTTTKYVTYAGFVRNSVSIVEVKPDNATPYLQHDYVLDRASFVFGERTSNGSVPRTGTGTFNGQMIASMVFNDQLDIDGAAPTYFQWMHGTSSTVMNFAANTFTLALNGTVLAPLFDIYTSKQFTLQNGATFTAAGSGRIDLVNAGGFLGSFQSAFFTNTNGDRLNVSIEGSSIDGALYGPAAEEVGGGFRIVGGVPDERVDILGAFTGVK
jgi:hypothetical protein